MRHITGEEWEWEWLRGNNADQAMLEKFSVLSLTIFASGIEGCEGRGFYEPKER